MPAEKGGIIPPRMTIKVLPTKVAEAAVTTVEAEGPDTAAVTVEAALATMTAEMVAVVTTVAAIVAATAEVAVVVTTVAAIAAAAVDTTAVVAEKVDHPLNAPTPAGTTWTLAAAAEAEEAATAEEAETTAATRPT